MYLVKSYQLVAGKCLVDKKSIVLQDTSFVNNDEILEYAVVTHEYTLSDGCYQKFRTLPPRTPIVVTVNKEVVFTAVNMPSFVSSTCDHSIVLTLNDSLPKIHVGLGYPGISHDPGIDDQWNNEILVSALAEQGKLQ